MKNRKILLDYCYKQGIKCLTLSGMADALYQAHKDGAQELYVSKTEWESVERWFVNNGAWDWDHKTFWGMEFVVEC